jgi:hypothetical protein
MENVNNGGNFQVENRSWLSRYVFDPSAMAGTRGTFTTITAAINQAIADGAILNNGMWSSIVYSSFIFSLLFPQSIFFLTPIFLAIFIFYGSLLRIGTIYFQSRSRYNNG